MDAFFSFFFSLFCRETAFIGRRKNSNVVVYIEVLVSNHIKPVVVVPLLAVVCLLRGHAVGSSNTF